MNSAIKDIRIEVKRFIDLADDKTVKMIYAMLEASQEEDVWSDAVFVAEMDRRTKEYESGTAKLYTLDQMEQHARLSFKERNK